MSQLTTGSSTSLRMPSTHCHNPASSKCFQTIPCQWGLKDIFFYRTVFCPSGKLFCIPCSCSIIPGSCNTILLSYSILRVLELLSNCSTFSHSLKLLNNSSIMEYTVGSYCMIPELLNMSQECTYVLQACKSYMNSLLLLNDFGIIEYVLFKLNDRMF